MIIASFNEQAQWVYYTANRAKRRNKGSDREHSHRLAHTFDTET